MSQIGELDRLAKARKLDPKFRAESSRATNLSNIESSRVESSRASADLMDDTEFKRKARGEPQLRKLRKLPRSLCGVGAGGTPNTGTR